MDSLSLHRGGWRDARAVLQALFAELAVYLNRAGGWAAQAPTTDLRTPPPTSRSPTRTKQPICRCNNIPRHFLRPTMIEFALLFTCFRKLGPGFRKPSAGPVDRGRISNFNFHPAATSGTVSRDALSSIMSDVGIFSVLMRYSALSALSCRSKPAASCGQGLCGVPQAGR